MPRLALAPALGIVLAAAALAQPASPPRLLHRVEPVYPPAAVQHRIQGIVRFSATIGAGGRIERLRLLSGHPLLVRAARDAVRRWVYIPALRGDRPIRTTIEITVPFELDPHGWPLKPPSPSASSQTAL